MSEHKKVLYPDHLLDDMQIEETIFPGTTDQVGVATLSHRIDANHILRIYQLSLNSSKEGYEIVQELAAFTFTNRNELNNFLENLPYLNGLEMLILLNPLNKNNLQNDIMIN